MTQVKTGLRGQSVTPEPDSYPKIPLPILHPDPTQRAVLEGTRKRFRFRSKAPKFMILLDSTPAHTVDGRLFDGSYTQIHFEADQSKPGFGLYETDDERENELLRKAGSFGRDFWDADQREREEQNQAVGKFVDMIEGRPDLREALLKRLKSDPDARDFSAILRPDKPSEPTFTS